MRNKSLPTVSCDTIGLCGISVRFRTLSPTQGQVAHALLTRPPLIPPKGSPFDLNVLCTPPALILSQYQTLEIMVSKRLGEESIKSISSLIAHLLFFRVVFSLSEFTRFSSHILHAFACPFASYLSLTVQFSRTVRHPLLRGDLHIIAQLKELVNPFLKKSLKNFLHH